MKRPRTEMRRLFTWPTLILLWSTTATSFVTDSSSSRRSHNHLRVLARPTTFDARQRKSVRRKYKRKRIPESEKELKSLLQERQAEYEQVVNEQAAPDVWSFESLFPEPMWDEATIHRDLYEVKERDSRPPESIAKSGQSVAEESSTEAPSKSSDKVKMKSSYYGGNAMMRVWREKRLNSALYIPDTQPSVNMTSVSPNGKVDADLSRLVRDRVYGFRRSSSGDYEYATSLMGDGAIQFRDGVRLGNPLKINADRLTWLAKKELQHGRVEEAQEMYDEALTIDPRDGRAYLGMSRCAERRRDFKLARKWLKAGIANSVSVNAGGRSDRGANPFLLQALGFLEEKMGNLGVAEQLYISAAKSRPSHAAAWIALAQIRTRKLGQSAAAGRVCFQRAERELLAENRTVTAHVYTAWANLEYKKAGDVRRARTLYQKALQQDERSSVAWLSLGVMEADTEKWKEAESCFESALKYDGRNSRVLQAYALMETRRPDGDSRKAIQLFERAMKANPRDAGVLQPYALYVAELGDIDMSRVLLRRATKINRRHAPVWQAWGVLEMRHGTAEAARSVFQEGIWSCAQPTGCQSGGYGCARLWQAWGVLEAKEGDHASARRCFSRALDADSRNVAAVTAWVQMEESLGNIRDARAIYERSLGQFSAGSNEKAAIWRGYELMEQRLGNAELAKQVYQRSMREVISATEEAELETTPTATVVRKADDVWKRSKEVEVVRWNGLGGEIWLNDNAIEGKVPFDMKKKLSEKKKRSKS